MSEVTTRPATRATKAPQRAEETHVPAQSDQQVNSGVSPSMIVLSLRPEGANFIGSRVERAQEAGFGWLRKVHLIGMSDPDTGGEIARHVVHSGHEAMGVLKEIQIHIDPETCALMWRAGAQLMEQLQKYAVLIGARICDGLGQPLSDEGMVAISNHIDAVISRRRDEDRAARIVTLPSGEKRLLSELSFAYEVIREAGSKKRVYRSVRFDVPSLHYYEGRALGIRLAGEVVDFYRKHSTQPLDILGILQDAIALNVFEYDKESQSSVASGFLEVMTTLIHVGALNLNPAWLDSQIKNQAVQHVSWLKNREERKADFVARMKAAREAKRLKGGEA